MAFEFRHSPGHLIRRCLQLHSTMFAEGLANQGITAPQWAAIRALHESPGIEQAKLAELIDYDRSTIGGMIDRLEKKGVVTRSFDVSDRRLKRLNLTPAGSALFKALHHRVRAVTDRFVSPLSPDEVVQLRSLLERLLARNEVDDASRNPHAAAT